MEAKKEDDETSGNGGEVNLAYQLSDSDPHDHDQEWPSFKEKLARFNSRDWCYKTIFWITDFATTKLRFLYD